MTPFDIGPVIARGNVATVHVAGDVATKLYLPGQPKTSAFREAANLAMVEALGLSVPQALGVLQIDGCWAVQMSRVGGEAFGAIMQREPAQTDRLLHIMSRLHRQMHAQSGDRFPPWHHRLARNIGMAAGLDTLSRQYLLDRLAALPVGDRLLHGDFHPFNVMGEAESSVVIDWLDAACGPPEADICRSFVLMAQMDAAMAERYLDAYLLRAALDRSAVMAWRPVVAGARLAENIAEGREQLLAWVREA